MSKYGKSIYYQTAIERHREMFREDVLKMVRKRIPDARRVSVTKPDTQGTIQGKRY